MHFIEREKHTVYIIPDKSVLDNTSSRGRWLRSLSPRMASRSAHTPAIVPVSLLSITYTIAEINIHNNK